MQNLEHPKGIVLAIDIEGAMWTFKPAETYQQIHLFSHLENFMRNPEVFQTPLNWMQINYWSYYGSVKGVIDLDLCYQFFKLSKER